MCPGLGANCGWSSVGHYTASLLKMHPSLLIDDRDPFHGKNKNIQHVDSVID